MVLHIMQLKSNNFVDADMSKTYSGKLKHFYALFLIPALLIGSCKNGNDQIDLSNIKLEVHIQRFDHDLNALAKAPMPQKAADLQKKYGAFYADMIERVLEFGSVNDTAYLKNLQQMYAGKPYQDLKHEVDSIYPDLNKQEEELTDAFKRIKYYFPQAKLPQVYAYFSGFQAQTTIGNGYVGVGLDMFLGARSKFYPALINTYPRYLSRRFTPDNLSPRVVEAVIREDMFPERDSDHTLLEHMIYEGKVLYLMDKLLPEVPDSTKIGYTTQQTEWCKAFEANVWGFFLEENLLYDTDHLKYQKYLTEAPFTPGLGEKNESAPKLAMWTGWQIVKQYMAKHPATTPKQLLAMTDAQAFLNNANYHPK